MNAKKFGKPYIRIVFLLGKIDVDVEARNCYHLGDNKERRKRKRKSSD